MTATILYLPVSQPSQHLRSALRAVSQSQSDLVNALDGLAVTLRDAAYHATDAAHATGCPNVVQLLKLADYMNNWAKWAEANMAQNGGGNDAA